MTLAAATEEAGSDSDGPISESSEDFNFKFKSPIDRAGVSTGPACRPSQLRQPAATGGGRRLVTHWQANRQVSGSDRP